jgi:Uma2 family endonuclease
MCPPPDTFSLGQTRRDMRYTVSMATLARSRRPATVRDLDDLPEDVIGQIVDGELIVHPRPDHPHVSVATRLTWMLVGPFDLELNGPGGWVILAEPRILFGEQLLIPDLAGWKRDRFVAPRKGPYTLSPDWVCEILSPSTARFDRVTKLPLYRHAGIGHVWVIDPIARTLEVLRRHEESWLIAAAYQNQDKVRAEPFGAVEIDLSLLWGEEENIPEE